MQWFGSLMFAIGAQSTVATNPLSSLQRMGASSSQLDRAQGPSFAFLTLLEGPLAPSSLTTNMATTLNVAAVPRLQQEVGGWYPASAEEIFTSKEPQNDGLLKQ